jgi:hypothetical protein
MRWAGRPGSVWANTNTDKITGGNANSRRTFYARREPNQAGRGRHPSRASVSLKLAR